MYVHCGQGDRIVFQAEIRMGAATISVKRCIFIIGGVAKLRVLFHPYCEPTTQSYCQWSVVSGPLFVDETQFGDHAAP